MAEEEKGFVIKDKRSFDDKGDLKEDAPAREEKEPEKGPEKEKPQEETGAEQAERPPLPEANFTSLIFSLSSSALINLGEVPDPNTGQKNKDLQIAKHTIDIIAMLQEKTEGNLTEDEKKFLDSVLADIRWRFVNAKK
jgi:hypothetical protein